MRRIRPGKAVIVGGIAALLAFVSLFFACVNLWTWSRMRTLPVEVMASSVVMDAAPYGRSKKIYPYFVLRLDLKATDGSGRLLHWEEDLQQASYPEEALDDLERWRPGTRHTIRTIRGNAREVRLPYGQELPERRTAISLLVTAVLLGLLALALITINNETASTFRNRTRFGVWMAFFAVGAVFALGALGFLAAELLKRFRWEQVEAKAYKSAFDVDRLPPNASATGVAKEALRNPAHRVLEFSWRGQIIHGGLGQWGGPYDHLSAHCDWRNDNCRFRLNPSDRWGASPLQFWTREFVALFGQLSFFAIVFLGAGLMLRSPGWTASGRPVNRKGADRAFRFRRSRI